MKGERIIKRIELYKQVFEKVFDNYITLSKKLNNISIYLNFQIKKFYSDIEMMESSNKVDEDIFRKLRTQIDDFIEKLEMSSLNSKLRASELEEIRGMTNVIGSIIKEEALNFSSRFNKFEKLFSEISDTMNFIIKEFKVRTHFFPKVPKALSQLKESIEDNVVPILYKVDYTWVDLDKLKYDFKVIIKLLDLILLYIERLNKNKESFLLNISYHKNKLSLLFRDLELMLEEYNNFYLKLTHLIIITKVKTGSSHKEKFIMIIDTLNSIRDEAFITYQKVLKIYEKYIKAMEKIEKVETEHFKIIDEILIYKYLEVINKIYQNGKGLRSFLEKEIKILDDIQKGDFGYES